jgi:hypothetical protein
MFNLFQRKKAPKESKSMISNPTDSNKNHSNLNYAWILTGKLAIGPMPRNPEDWILLENNCIKKRFSCCYPAEHIFSPIPSGWKSKEVSLPDHRKQETLTHMNLVCALNEAIDLINDDNAPMYLHCFAGQERSSLIATGIVSLMEKKDLFEALAYVRQCYPNARPLYEHLDVLEKALKEYP